MVTATTKETPEEETKPQEKETTDTATVTTRETQNSRVETQIDKAFKDDSAELGVMMHK
jgi:hypothetical protein